jgi:hypothetical protein
LVDIRNSVLHNKPDTFRKEFSINEPPPQKTIDDHPKFIRRLNPAVLRATFTATGLI